MSANYGICTNTFSALLENKAYDYESEIDSFFLRYFASRFTYLVNIPVGVITRIIDTAIATILIVGSLATLSRDENAFSLATTYLHSFSMLVPTIFNYIIKVVNPSSKISSKSFYCLQNELNGETSPKVKNLTDLVALPVLKKALALKKSDNILIRHVFSRVLCALTIPLKIITRVVDLAIGLIAAAAAIVMLGRKSTLNNYAIHFLGITKLVQDIFIGVSYTINPWAEPASKKYFL